MNKKFQQGVTLIEIIVVMIVISVLFGFANISLTTFRQKSSIKSVTNSLITDIKDQQLKAMTGETYGIYFENKRYVLFNGSSYSPSEETSFSVDLEDNLEFQTITFPDASIVFEQGTGNFVGFIPLANQITLIETGSDETKTIVINRYGVVTAVN